MIQDQIEKDLLITLVKRLTPQDIQKLKDAIKDKSKPQTKNSKKIAQEKKTKDEILALIPKWEVSQEVTTQCKTCGQGWTCENKVKVLSKTKPTTPFPPIEVEVWYCNGCQALIDEGYLNTQKLFENFQHVVKLLEKSKCITHHAQDVGTYGTIIALQSARNSILIMIGGKYEKD